MSSFFTVRFFPWPHMVTVALSAALDTEHIPRSFNLSEQ